MTDNTKTVTTSAWTMVSKSDRGGSRKFHRHFPLTCDEFESIVESSAPPERVCETYYDDSKLELMKSSRWLKVRAELGVGHLGWSLKVSEPPPSHSRVVAYTEFAAIDAISAKLRWPEVKCQSHQFGAVVGKMGYAPVAEIGIVRYVVNDNLYLDACSLGVPRSNWKNAPPINSMAEEGILLLGCFTTDDEVGKEDAFQHEMMKLQDNKKLVSWERTLHTTARSKIAEFVHRYYPSIRLHAADRDGATDNFVSRRGITDVGRRKRLCCWLPEFDVSDSESD